MKIKNTMLFIAILVVVIVLYWWNYKTTENNKKRRMIIAQEEEKFLNDFSFIGEDLYYHQKAALDAFITNKVQLLEKINREIEKENKDEISEHRRFLEETMIEFLKRDILEARKEACKLEQQHQLGKLKFDPITLMIEYDE